MGRVRISTTVDEDRLNRARGLVKQRDAAVLDEALKALIEKLESQAELEVLKRLPYEDDPELAVPEIAPADGLPYDGDVPADVQRAFERRRGKSQK